MFTKLLIVLLLLPVILLAGGLLLNRPPLLAPPGVLPRLQAYLTTNSWSTHRQSVYPELETRSYQASAGQLRSALQTAIVALGWQPMAPVTGQGPWHIVVTTPLWRFKDDITVTLSDASAGGYWLDIAGQSRLGKGDLAANTRHILRLYDAVEQALQDAGIDVMAGSDNRQTAEAADVSAPD